LKSSIPRGSRKGRNSRKGAHVPEERTYSSEGNMKRVIDCIRPRTHPQEDRALSGLSGKMASLREADPGKKKRALSEKASLQVLLFPIKGESPS